IYLDFDGTLADIVARPEQARPAIGVLDLVPRLVAAYGLVAVVSGRPASEVAKRIAVGGIEVFGLYGLGRERDDAAKAARPHVDLVAATEKGAWVEDKGGSAASDYRQAPGPEHARRTTE